VGLFGFAFELDLYRSWLFKDYLHGAVCFCASPRSFQELFSGFRNNVDFHGYTCYYGGVWGFVGFYGNFDFGGLDVAFLADVSENVTPQSARAIIVSSSAVGPLSVPPAGVERSQTTLWVLWLSTTERTF